MKYNIYMLLLTFIHIYDNVHICFELINRRSERVMFEKWNLPDNICSDFPIGINRLDLFVGHSKQRKFIDSLLNTKSVILLEGDIGVGKTSLGNVVRLGKNGVFTPISEIGVKPHWNNDDFLAVIIATIAKDICNPNSRLHSLKSLAAVKNALGLFDNIKTQVGGVSLMGSGVTMGASLSRPLQLNQAVLIDAVEKLGAALSKKLDVTSPIIIQINNLDLGNSFSEERMITFFNEIRDTLQLPYINWVICGSTGIGSFITRNIARVSQIITHHEIVEPLSIDDIKRALLARANFKNSERFPITDDLIELLYSYSSGSFREILRLLNGLLIYYHDNPLVDTIGVNESKYFFAEKVETRVVELQRSRVAYRCFEMICEFPGINQKDLAKKTGKSQSNISKIAKDMESAGYIRIVRKQKSVAYNPTAMFRLAEV